MSSFLIAFVMFACMLVGILSGLYFHRRLSTFHLKGDSKDIMITAAGMMATLVALIIGLQLSSAKGSYDEANARLKEGGSKAITLDYVLSLYGPDTKEIRNCLRDAIAVGFHRIWHIDDLSQFKKDAWQGTNGMTEVYTKIHQLMPQNESQKDLKTEALQLSADLMQSRWMLIEQTDESLPPAFLVVLAFWLVVLFVFFELIGSPNRTTTSALIISALSLSSAIFFILELNHPLVGPIKVPSASLEQVLNIIDK